MTEAEWHEINMAQNFEEDENAIKVLNDLSEVLLIIWKNSDELL